MEISPKLIRILSGEEHGVLPALARCALSVASLFYGIAVRVRNWFYNHGLLTERRLPMPVVSIGNITTGGTGKTPAVEFAAKWFIEHRAKPAILSRGYRSRSGRNDEKLMLDRRLPGVPHYQNPDRYAAAIEAHQAGADVLILDDGFQHRRLGRFLDIVLIDALNPFGFGRLLPRGLLREPLASLRRADIIIITRADLITNAELDAVANQLKAIAPNVPQVLSRHAARTLKSMSGETRGVDFLKGKKASLLCSIGHPQAFRKTVEALGADVRSVHEFPDHHWYSQDELRQVADDSAGCVLVTTEKDAVKLDGVWPGGEIWILDIEMEITRNGEALSGMLEEVSLALKDETAEPSCEKEQN